MDDVTIENRLTKVEESTKSAHHRIDGMESMQKDIHDLVVSVSKLAGSVENLCTDMTEVTGRVKCMEEKPAKRWDQLVGLLMAALVSGLIGFLISQLLNK